MSSSQLTNSYFSEGWPNHQPDVLVNVRLMFNLNSFPRSQFSQLARGRPHPRFASEIEILFNRTWNQHKMYLDHPCPSKTTYRFSKWISWWKHVDMTWNNSFFCLIYIYMGFHHSNHCEHAWARRPHVHQGEKSTEAMVKLAWFLTGQRPIGTSHEKHPINCWMMIVPRPKHISPGNVGELYTYWPIWIYYLDNDIFDILHNGDIEYGYIHNDLFWSQMSISAETKELKDQGCRVTLWKDQWTGRSHYIYIIYTIRRIYDQLGTSQTESRKTQWF